MSTDPTATAATGECGAAVYDPDNGEALTSCSKVPLGHAGNHGGYLTVFDDGGRERLASVSWT